MIEEFRTNPSSLKMKGNIIGSEIGMLVSVTGFDSYKAVLTSDTPITEGGITFNVAKLIYSA